MRGALFAGERFPQIQKKLHPFVIALEGVAKMVAAYAGSNSLRPADLPLLIEAVYAGLKALGSAPEPIPDFPTPPVPIRKTITPDYIINLEDGPPYKSLRRRLSVRGMTPELYRTKWGLKPDYPMVAANYAAQGSEMAKAIGLGRKRTAPEPAHPAKRSRKTQAADPA